MKRRPRTEPDGSEQAEVDVCLPNGRLVVRGNALVVITVIVVLTLCIISLRLVDLAGQSVMRQGGGLPVENGSP